MKGEKGFILPMALFLALLACTMLILSVDIFLGEKKYAVLVKEYYIRNTMSVMAIREVARRIEEGNFGAAVLRFSDGIVSYTVKKDGDEAAISLQTENESGEQFKSEIIYNHAEKKVIRWVEK